MRSVASVQCLSHLCHICFTWFVTFIVSGYFTGSMSQANKQSLRVSVIEMQIINWHNVTIKTILAYLQDKSGKTPFAVERIATVMQSLTQPNQMPLRV